MPLPLLALRASEVSAPFPDNKITIILDFEPKGECVLLWVSPSMPTAPSTKRVVERLVEWVSVGLVEKAGVGSRLNGKLRWSINWQDFNSSVALTTCKSVNSPGGAASVPYTLVDFQQSLLDDNGKQIIKFEFALESDLKLSEWLRYN